LCERGILLEISFAIQDRNFRRETAGMEIPSTIGEVVPLKKLAWSGETGGILGIHVWNFWANSEGTRVRTRNHGRDLHSPHKSRKSKSLIRRFE